MRYSVTNPSTYPRTSIGEREGVRLDSYWIIFLSDRLSGCHNDSFLELSLRVLCTLAAYPPTCTYLTTYPLILSPFIFVFFIRKINDNDTHTLIPYTTCAAGYVTKSYAKHRRCLNHTHIHISPICTDNTRHVRQ